jgi:hypothetical protein
MHEVSSKKAVETKWICKIDESKGWGVADYELIVEERDARPLPRSFKLYGQGENMEIEGQNDGATSHNEDMQMNQDNYTDMNHSGQDGMNHSGQDGMNRGGHSDMNHSGHEGMNQGG